MPFVTIGNDKVYYAEHVPASPRGAPVVFVHGAAGSHLVWGAQARALG